MDNFIQIIQMFDIRKEALELGFSVAAVVEPCSLADEYGSIFEQRLASDYDQQIAYMRRNLDKRLDPCKLVEGARTIVVCGLSSSNLPFAASPSARIASYGLCRDYHLILKDLLSELLSKLKQAYPHAQARTFVDTAPVLEKAWAEKAGLGYIGRNNLLINNEFGTRLFLGELITDIYFEPTNLTPPDISCKNCTACIDCCPTGALKLEGGIDTRLCISRLTIEKVDRAYSRAELDGWIFGCEACQAVCPHNFELREPERAFFKPLCSPAPTPEQWAEMSSEQFKAEFADTPLSRSDLERIKNSL